MGSKNNRRAGVEMRAALWAARHPGIVGAPGGVLATMAELGPATTGTMAAGAVLGGLGWMRAHPTSFTRYGAPVLRGGRRRWTRYVGPNWKAALTACDLVRQDRHSGATLVPRVLRVSSPTPTIDRVKIRLVRGQSARTFTERSEELAAALKADSLGITKIRPHILMLTVVRGNPFTSVVPAAEIPDDTAEVDFAALDFGETEYGDTWTEPATCHLLGAGATGSGKSGLMWNPLRQLTPAIRDGLVRVWMVDPKGGMETRRAATIFHRYADHVDDSEEYDPEDETGTAYPGEAALDLIEAFRDEMKHRQTVMSADGQRKHTIDSSSPLNLLVIDELAMLTALGGSPRLLNKVLAEIMTQGRAAGFHVWAFVQEPTKDIVPIRELFTRRVTLRTTTASYVDMVLGEDARSRGALADEIPADEAHAGIGFRTDDRTRTVLRIRAGLVTDDDIDELVRHATPRHHADTGGEVVPFPTAA